MGLLDNFNDKLSKYLGLKKQDVSVQIFEETVSSEPIAVPAGKNIKPQLGKKIGDVISEDEREKARKEALAQLEKEADEAADE